MKIGQAIYLINFRLKLNMNAERNKSFTCASELFSLYRKPTSPQATHQGSVVESVVSLTRSLMVISLTVLADSIYNILIFFAEKHVRSFCSAKATHSFSAKNFSIFAYHSM